ncbi:MAG: MFS transporter [Caulobacteraceae bacterium]
MSSSQSAASKPLATPRILGFASTGIPQAAILLATGTYLVPLYTVHVGISLAAYSLTTVAVRLIDLTVDPFLGWAMDRTNTALGRFRPWFIAGVPITLLGVYMLLNPPKGADVFYLGLWYLTMWIGVSMLTLSHASWAASLSVNYHERSRIYGWMTFMGPIGSVGLLAMPLLVAGAPVLGKPESYAPVTMLIMAALPVTTFLMATFTPERLKAEATTQKFGFKDYIEIIKRPTMMKLIWADLFLVLGPGVTGPLYNFFFGQIKKFPQEEINFLLIFYIGAALLGGLLWPRVAKRFGKHRTLQISCVLYAIAQTSLMIMPAGQFGISCFGMFCVGFCVSAHILMIRAMVADYADEIRLEQGKERAGVLYALVTTTQKLGASFNVLLVLPLLQFVFHFEPRKPVNDEFALIGLQLCYLFTPIIFVFAAAAMFFKYALTEERHQEIRDALAAKEEALSVEMSSEASAPAST